VPRALGSTETAFGRFCAACGRATRHGDGTLVARAVFERSEPVSPGGAFVRAVFPVVRYRGRKADLAAFEAAARDQGTSLDPEARPRGAGDQAWYRAWAHGRSASIASSFEVRCCRSTLTWMLEGEGHAGRDL